MAKLDWKKVKVNSKLPRINRNRCFTFSKSYIYIYLRRKWQLTLVVLPGKSHGWRSLEGYSPWGSQRFGHNWETHTYTHTHIEERVSGACPWVCGEGHKIPSELLQTQLHWELKALQQTGCMEFLEAPVMMFKKQISEVFSGLSSGMILALFLLRRDLWEKIEAVLSDRRTMEPCFRWDLKNYRYGTLHS